MRTICKGLRLKARGLLHLGDAVLVILLQTKRNAEMIMGGSVFLIQGNGLAKFFTRLRFTLQDSEEKPDLIVELSGLGSKLNGLPEGFQGSASVAFRHKSVTFCDALPEDLGILHRTRSNRNQNHAEGELHCEPVALQGQYSHNRRELRRPIPLQTIVRRFARLLNRSLNAF